jgi:trans-aconitate methyltransferase
MPVSAEDVRGAYRFILGREPENEEVVAHHQRHNTDFEMLRRIFLGSAEFHDKNVYPKRVPLTAPPRPVETVADAAALRAILAKLALVWEEAGKQAPHFSVASYDKFRPERLAETEPEFFESGKDDRDLVLGVLRRIGRPPESFRCCLEYGCGIGRVTAHLATCFAEMIAVDISPPHLLLAQRHLAQLGHRNVDFRQATLDDFHPASGYDLWFSRLVLQHNPPPLVLAILDRMFAGLAPRGIAIVHVPTYCGSYVFNVADYLADKLPPLHQHMHATPQRPIIELASRHGCPLIDVREEDIPEWVTNIFVFEKVGASEAGRAG